MGPEGSCGQVPWFPHPHRNKLSLAAWAPAAPAPLCLCARQVSDSWGSCLLLTNEVVKTGHDFPTLWIGKLTGKVRAWKISSLCELCSLSLEVVKINLVSVGLIFNISSPVTKALTFFLLFILFGYFWEELKSCQGDWVSSWASWLLLGPCCGMHWQSLLLFAFWILFILGYAFFKFRFFGREIMSFGQEVCIS